MINMKQKKTTHPTGIDKEIPQAIMGIHRSHLLFFGRARTTTRTAGGLSVGIRFGIYRDLTFAVNFFLARNTLPKTNIAPKNGGFQ